MSATISVAKHGNSADAQEALFNLRPLSLYKVPDTLTSAAICANYAIYLSQRPEKAEVDAVRSVLEGMPPPEERASDNHKDESRINDDIVRSNYSTAGQANVFNTVRAGGSVIDCSNNMTRTPKTQTPLRVHFCGLSSALAVSTIEARRREGREDVSCGTAPHYLMSSSEILPPGCTLAKCSPPIRDGENMRMLRESVTTGAVTTLASWHLEFEPRQKMLHSGDLIRSIGGIDSMETLVPACWTFCRDVGLGPEVMGALLSKAPADSLGLGGTKGSIRVGVMADLCVIDL